MIIERQTQHVRAGKWGGLDDLDAKFNAIEARYGFPQNKRRLRCFIGGHDADTLIVEREWESLAAMEAAYGGMMADPEWMQVSQEANDIIESLQIEVYVHVP